MESAVSEVSVNTLQTIGENCRVLKTHKFRRNSHGLADKSMPEKVTTTRARTPTLMY